MQKYKMSEKVSPIWSQNNHKMCLSLAGWYCALDSGKMFLSRIQIFNSKQFKDSLN